MRRPTLSLLLLLTASAAAGIPDQPAPREKPNLVVFLADDAGYGDFGATGNSQLNTPHIDSLAGAGATLSAFTVCPVCAPTRAEFLTGRYHLRSGVQGVSTGFERMDLTEHTIADSFRAAGYATGAFGKWHNGSQWPYHPMARGFDTYFGHTAGHWGEYFDPPLEREGVMERTEGYIADVCTSEAIAFIDAHHDRPFFCFIPFTTPHSPWAVPEKYWARFKGRPITQPSTEPEREDLDHTRCALAMMENLDDNVGRVLAALDGHGLTRDTIVVFFSDNGPNSWRYNGGLKGRKGSTDDGGVRSVCFIRYPARLPGGQAVDRIAAGIDLFPTLAALAGVTPANERPFDGLDLSPLFSDAGAPWPDRTIFTTWNRRTSARTQRFLLDQDGRLFDRLADPGQTVDVAAEHPEQAAALAAQVAAWQEEVFPEQPPKDRRAAVDPRPIHVGFPEFPITMLPARDATPHGEIRRSASAPNCSYFVGWTSPDDHISWEVEVVTAGRYRASIDYTVPDADAGATVELRFLDASHSAKVMPGWDPPLYTNQDTLPRPPAESTMKEFKPLDLGTLTLPEGRGQLTLRATEIPGDSVMDLRRLTLTLLDP